ncbi:MAG: OmpA family protein, partial [Bacteroidota bacterium]
PTNFQTFLEDDGTHSEPNPMEDVFYLEKDKYALTFLENKQMGRKKRILFNQKGQLLYSIYEDRRWGSVTIEFEDSKKKQKVAHATLSQDTRMVILSKMNQEGDFDLYETRYNPKSKKWTKPSPIDILNTAGNEVTPFLDKSNTLYFSSTGHGAISESLDVFQSTFDSESGKWSEPENLYTPINTAFNEAYFSIEDGVGYLCSDRKDRQAKGGMDIYRVYDFRYMKLRGNIYDRYLEEALEGVQVSVRYADDLYAIDTAVTNKRGYYEFKKLPVNRPLEFFITYKDKFCYAERFVPTGFMLRNKKNRELVHNFYIHTTDEGIPSLPSNADEDVTFFSEDPKIGDRFILKTVKFRSGTTDILSESMQELDRFADFLQRHPDLPKIEIGGHTDNIGDPDKNLELSEFRARRVVEYLVKKHKLAESRFTTAGYGETRPIASNDDEKEGRELNRRIEAKLVR